MDGEAGRLGNSERKELIWWSENNMGSQSPAAYNPWPCNVVSIGMKTSVRSTRGRALKGKDDVETLQETLQEKEQDSSV